MRRIISDHSRDIVEKVKIEPNTDIKIFIREKKIDLNTIFGTLAIKKPTQELLDEIRKSED
jgi:hypothetical protein